MNRNILIFIFTLGFTFSCKPPEVTQKVHLQKLGQNDKIEGPGEELKEEDWINEMSGLSKDYSTFPSSEDIKNRINSYVTSSDGCPQYYDNTNPNKSMNPAAKGARMLLATMFQSCAAIDNVIGPSTPNLKGVDSARSYGKQKGVSGGKLRRIYSSKSYINSHIVLSKLAKDPNYPAKGCKSMLDKPPVYGYGSRTGVSKSGGVKLFKGGSGVAKTSSPASGIDCSAFISTALGSQGLKVTTAAGPFTSNTTRSFHALTKQKNSCLKKASFEGDETIKAGDMLNVAGSHIVMIDGVGADPLGINKHATAGTCNSINVADFDFTFIHSGALKNSYGPSRVHISTYANGPGTMFNSLRQIALKTCLSKVKGKTGKVSTASLTTNSRFSLIRHQSDKPSCRSKKRVKLEGESCVKQCLEQEGQTT
ncbi:hypothetical protein A9Q84_04775 [Halobacteriovorax marinus]|uniref:NlpC/P60 domain-containing protein n=1 Tax=Halobacteriovorax marinus TaxID=97084 RepID=A0A1Y5FAL2_9BACT|nr:hypothetical protein A9Q84_04775 [Halobacteriovorax marinus]